MLLAMLRRLLARFRRVLSAPEQPPIKAPDFLKLDNSSPVAKYVGIAGAAAAILAAGTYIIQTAPRPPRSTETIAPVAETKLAEVEPLLAIPESQSAMRKTARPASAFVGTVHVKSHYRNGVWVKGYDRGPADGNPINNKRPQKRAD